MHLASRSYPSADPLVVLAVVLNGIGTLVMVGGMGAGVFALALAWVLLAHRDRRLLVLSLVFTVPVTTFGWESELGAIQGRIFDARLAVTFVVCAVAGVALLGGRRMRPDLVELLFTGFAGMQVASGLLAADSVLTWVPPVARTFAYGSMYALARRSLNRPRDLERTVALAGLGFGIPTLAGVVQFAVGEAEYLNEALRATSPGGRGPISLAFVGQATSLAALGLAGAASTRSQRLVWWMLAAVGGLGILASATRLVTATAWVAAMALVVARRRWTLMLLVVLVGISALMIRGDLLGRYLGTVEDGPTSTGVSVPSSQPTAAPTEGGSTSAGSRPDHELVADASLRFRLFVWSAILTKWVQEHPVTGIGPGMTAQVVAEISSADRAAPHNDYIGVLAETGLFGFALFLGLQLAAIHTLHRLHGAPRRQDGLRITVVVLFIATNVLGALNNPMYFLDVQVPTWALIGACVAAGTSWPCTTRSEKRRVTGHGD